MKKILLLLMVGATLMFAKVDLNSASKEELMSIKGIGEKKAEQIIEYRKSNKIKSVEELAKLKGFGPSLIKNIQEDKKVK